MKVGDDDMRRGETDITRRVRLGEWKGERWCVMILDAGVWRRRTGVGVCDDWWCGKVW